jgi:phage-related protein/uncharacterized protein YukE
MAVVGEAHIIVRAITNRVRPDIENAFNGVQDLVGNIGNDAGNAFSRGMSRGMGRGGGGFLDSNFAKSAEAARIKFGNLVTASYFLGPAIASVVGAIGALGAGLISLVSVLGAAAPSAIVFAGALTAVAQAAVVARVAFGGVAAALQAGLKTQKAAIDNSRQIERAEKRLLEARVRLRRLIDEEGPERLAQAQERVRDATDSAADAQISAQRAERSYQDAQKKTKKALEDLNEARDEAKEKIQQLRFEVEGGAISEKKARLEFEKARDALQRVQDLPPNSRARQEAELAFAEADLNLRKAIDRNKDLKKEEAAATKAGVEGSKSVQAAVESLDNARKDETEAGQDAARANRDLAKAQEAMKKAVADAGPGGTVMRDLSRDISDARDAVKEAQKDLADAKKGPAGAADAFADAMSKLSPEAQRFVKYLISIQGEFRKLRAAAGKELFPRLEIAIQNLVDNLFPRLAPLLEGTGKVLGEVAIDLSKTITQADNLKNLETVWKNNDKFITNLGKATGNLYGAFLSLLAAAGPLIDRFGEWLVKITETFEQTTKAKQATGELTENFNKAGDVAARIGGILKNYFQGFREIGKAVMEGGAGERLLKYFEDASQRFEDLMKQMNADGSLGKYFDDATRNALKVLDLLTNIVAEVLKLGDDSGVGSFVDYLSQAVDVFGRIGAKLTGSGDSLGKFVLNFALLIEKFTETGSIDKFFSIVNRALEIANTIFGNSGVQKALGYAATVFAVFRAFNFLLKPIKFVGKALIGSVLKPFQLVKKATSFFGNSKDPFSALRKGSGLTRAELTKQMVVDKQKALAMKGIFITGKQAAASINLIPPASNKARAAMTGSATAATRKTIAVKMAGAASRVAAVGMKVGSAAARGFGAALSMVGGPIGVILLLLPFIIGFIKKLWEENETFRAVVEKVMGIVKGLWEGFMSLIETVWNFVKPIFEFIGNAVKTYITTYVQGLKLAWEAIKTAVMAVWNFLKPIFQFIGNAVKTYITFYVNALKTAWDLIKTAVQNVWDFLRPIFTTIGNAIKNSITFYVDALKKAWDLFKTGVQAVWDFIRPIFTSIGNGIKNSITFFINAAKTGWDNFKNNIQTVWNFIKPIIDRIGSAIRTTIGTAIDKIKGTFDSLKTVFKTVFNFLATAWNNTAGKLKFSVPGWVPGIGGKSFGIPSIPLLAEGGVVPATPGGMLAKIGEAGRPERVEPLDPDGLSKRDKAMIQLLAGPNKGVTVNVYPSAGMDERELAELVSRKMASMMRKGAA